MSVFFPYLLTGLMTVFLSSNGYLSYRPFFLSFPSITINLPYDVPGIDYHTRDLLRFITSPQQVSITELIANSQDYDQQLVSVQGRVIQPELHLDETELYVDFVFRLTEGNDSIVVFGRHDRTQGALPIIVNHSVEVIGTFLKEETRNGFQISNILEALSVTPYPLSIPEST